MKKFLLYLIGKPGIGKYTIAKAISEKYNFILCDNHLINNPIFSLLRFDKIEKVPNFAWDCIERIRDNVFDFIAHDNENNYILTNVLFNWHVGQEIFNKVKKISEANSSIFVPVKMHLHDENEHLSRIQNPERKSRFKSIKPSDIEKDKDLLDINERSLLDLDITGLSTEEIVERIVSFAESFK
jgi:hypothetical protein